MYCRFQVFSMMCTNKRDFFFVFQGDDADCMYFVEDGEVRVMIKAQVITELPFVLFFHCHFSYTAYNHIVQRDC